MRCLCRDYFSSSTEEKGGTHCYTIYYSLTEEKNQSVLINNIHNSQRDLNSVHLRCHRGSRHDCALFCSAGGKNWPLVHCSLCRGQFVSMESTHWTTGSHWNGSDVGRAQDCSFLLAPGGAKQPRDGFWWFCFCNSKSTRLVQTQKLPSLTPELILQC